MFDKDAVYQARFALRLSATDAGKLIYVTKRTWELYEAGRLAMPRARTELLIQRLQERQTVQSDLVIIFADKQKVINVIPNDMFCSISENNEDKSLIIKSLSINRATRRPCVLNTHFALEHNKHVSGIVANWDSALECGTA
jgi:hypothetical protein